MSSNVNDFIDFNTIHALVIIGDENEYRIGGSSLTPEQKTRVLDYLKLGSDKILEENPNSDDYITIATYDNKGTQINELYLARQHFIDLEKARPVTPPLTQRPITSENLKKFNASLAVTKKVVANAAARQHARQQAGINAAKAKAAAAAKAHTTASTTFKAKPMPSFGGKRTRRQRKQTRRR
jgi:hypothetical protein